MLGIYLNIKDLSNEVFYNMEKYSQLTIDLVEEAEDLLNEETFTQDDIGSLQYKIENVNEIMCGTLEDDLDVIERLLAILDNEYKKLNENNNNI